MSIVETLGLEVTVVDAAGGGHEDVGHGRGGVSPVHCPPAEGRPGVTIINTISGALHERDGVTITAATNTDAIRTLLEQGFMKNISLK